MNDLLSQSTQLPSILAAAAAEGFKKANPESPARVALCV